MGEKRKNGLSLALHLRIAHTGVRPLAAHDEEGTRLHVWIGQLFSFRHAPPSELGAVDDIDVTFLVLAAWIGVVVQESVGLEHEPTLLPRLDRFTCRDSDMSETGIK